MDIAFVKSDNIDVFPSADRKFKFDGKFTSESNITGILRNALPDIEGSYVINISDTEAEFVIHGYYFKVTGAIGDIKDKYAAIYIDKTTGRLVDDKGGTDLDNGDEFRALIISDKEPSISEGATYDVYTLKLTADNKTLVGAERVKYDESNVNEALNTLNEDMYGAEGKVQNLENKVESHIENLESKVDSHIDNNENPHGVTRAQVGTTLIQVATELPESPESIAPEHVKYIEVDEETTEGIKQVWKKMGSEVSVSSEGTSTEEVKYITIDGEEKKLAGSDYEPLTEEQLAAINSGINKGKVELYDKSIKIVLVNTAVNTGEWVSFSEPEATGYGYKAEITNENISSDSYVDCIFSTVDATSGNFAPITKSITGGFYIFAKKIPTANITLPTIVIWN